jgi:ketosteroid isomerase-like protein
MQFSDDVFAFADRFIDALNAGDAARVREFYQPDATVWHNFDNADQPLTENLKLLEWMVRKAPERRYRVLRREIVPGGWFQQHVLEARLADGREMKLYACCVITLQDGRIKRIEEYVDPAQAAVLREAKTARA